MSPGWLYVRTEPARLLVAVDTLRCPHFICSAPSLLPRSCGPRLRRTVSASRSGAAVARRVTLFFPLTWLGMGGRGKQGAGSH